MEKKVECKIVQDLLLGYVDNVLNEETKNLVEKHLSECSICRDKLEEIKSDIKENDNIQKREIDYLKKIRRNSIIRSIIIAISIIITIFFIIILSKFIIINNIFIKGEKSLQTENFYKETREEIQNGEVSITEEYYKDGKYKSIWKIYSDEGAKIMSTTYKTVDSDECVTIYENEKIARIEKGNLIKDTSSEEFLKLVPFIQDNNIIATIGKAFLMSIDTYNDNGEYYVLKYKYEKPQNWEIWIDKKTCLPIKLVNKNGRKSFFTGTDIVKEVSDNTQEYKYEFGTVTDEDVKVPDISGYEKEYYERNIEV